jgi:hypothetical protein
VRALLVAAIASVCGVAASACGGDGDPERDPPRTLPACARPAERIPRPSDLPADLLLPPGTALAAAERISPRELLIRGAAPGSLDDVASFLEDELPDAGYELGDREGEVTERELVFAGQDLRAGVRLNAIPGCSGAVRLELLLARAE